MKGTEHFRAAESCLNSATIDNNMSMSMALLAEAQVHATLAAAVSISNLVSVWGDIAAMMRADSELADAEPPRAEPLVTCDATPIGGGPYRCGLTIGHDGLHEHVTGAGTLVSWSSPEELRTITPEPPTTTEHWNAKLIREEAEAQRAKSIYQSTATDLHMEMPR